jgi:hypothetical protein
MPSKTCTFCRGPAENSTRDGRVCCCRRCAKDVVLPMLKDILGPDELARAVAVLRPMPSGLGADRGTQMSRGRGKPVKQPQRTRMTREQVQLGLARAAARLDGRTLKADVREMARKAGFAVNESAGEAELGIAVSAAAKAPARALTPQQVEARRLAKAAGFATYGDDDAA